MGQASLLSCRIKRIRTSIPNVTTNWCQKPKSHTHRRDMGLDSPALSIASLARQTCAYPSLSSIKTCTLRQTRKVLRSSGVHYLTKNLRNSNLRAKVRSRKHTCISRRCQSISRSRWLSRASPVCYPQVRQRYPWEANLRAANLKVVCHAPQTSKSQPHWYTKATTPWHCGPSQSYHGSPMMRETHGAGQATMTQRSRATGWVRWERVAMKASDSSRFKIARAR